MRSLVLFCFLWITCWPFFALADDIYSGELTPRAHSAIEKGLAYLANTQKEDGSWHCNIGYKLNESYQVTQKSASHVGVTSLACIAFLANGNLPDRGIYGRNVRKGLEFVLSCANESNGFISKNGTRMYSHAFATLFLAEVYGMSEDKEIRTKLERAVHFITSGQNEQGAWRYVPYAADSDMSITVCQVQALRAARNAGIRVPKKNIERAIRYIQRSASPMGGFNYQLLGESESRVTYSITAAGVTALYGAGIYDDISIQRGLDYLLNPPRTDPHQPYPGHYFYSYGNYYAVQAMFTAGGEYWEKWFTKTRDELISLQDSQEGSWNDNVGKPLATATSVIVLSIPFRYLPIFQR